ncbi:Zinc finger protein ZAT5 [Glycine soja]|uniref:Zinc finger protein ZAT5 n=1 Tax=Glycine soja TaxID=3848 RepID=A0A445HFV8_GLYSO|nr:zinc finger protein ZAT5-like [Glycine soja]KHN48238.1 Zinc finger protein ZAT5 [Glycine soja]RZB72584.1 Zinc finger protein ZAT5 [Glycine soja]
MQVQEELLVASKDHTHQMMMIKGKRTKRQRAPSPLSLAMPYNNSTSSSTNNSIDSATTSPSPTNTIELREDEDMANCLILLAQGRHHVAAPTSYHNNDNNDNHKSTSLYLYQCKTCNRYFPSFQALGGHRASHKKPKQNGTFSSEAVTTFVEENNDRYDPTTSTTLSLKIPNGVNNNMCSTTTTTTTKAKVHECSICGAEFSSGQALGGHMRRHRTLVNASLATSMSGGNVGVGGSNEFQEAKKPLKLDLNLPALPEDDHRESKFSFQQREKNVIVFSKQSSLVDCHY